MQHIESKLKNVNTFTNTYKAFYNKKDINFGENTEPFKLSSKAKKRSVLTEELLPILLGFLWLISGGVGIYLMVTKHSI